MYNTKTSTKTYTVIDIKKTFEGFEADLRMIVRRTGKWTMSYTDDVFHDIIKLAENKYLKSVDIVLIDSNKKPIKASKYIINENGTATSGDRPGKNNWEDIENTTLSVILSFTTSWKGLSSQSKEDFKQKNEFKIDWINSSINNSFPNLNKSNAQLYASKGYELNKTNYE